ncbi:hypothetical protein N8142_01120 [bacterium]|nr:hypothetical protein [Amylibacter sp.]MDC1420610.1 hypothetical protein [bacterium]|tara:strand:+ start:536 stop:1186 length:651 start_codon:yes stop_codon:yes gene_type:complete
MKLLIIIILLIPLSANSESLAKEFEQQKNESLNPKNSLESELMYELMHYKRMLITEALNAPQYNLFDNNGSKFITNKYIVEFDLGAGETGPRATLDFLGSRFKCKNKEYTHRKTNFSVSMPRIIGVKNGPVYVNLSMPANSYEPIKEFEIDLQKPGHCYTKYMDKVKRCSISKYDPNQKSLLRSNIETIKVAFDRNLRDCKTAYNDPKFEKLRFSP